MTQGEQRILGQLEAQVAAGNDRLERFEQKFDRFLEAHDKGRSDCQSDFRGRLDGHEAKITKLESRELLRVSIYPALTGAGVTGLFLVLIELAQRLLH